MSENLDHYALVVGIDDYPHFRPLRGARQDAMDFEQWLLSESGGHLPQNNVRTVFSSAEPLAPIHDNIDDELAKIKRALKGRAAKRLYVYFSGHGLARSRFETDLCLAKWSRERSGIALDSRDYLNLLVESGWFEEIVMFLDCCRIRNLGNRALSSTIDLVRPGDGAAQTQYFLVNATEFDRAAYEDSNDESTQVRGLFTKALLEGLNGRAARPEGGVTVNRLKEYIVERLKILTDDENKRQVPEFEGALNGMSSAMVFGNAVPPIELTEVTISFSPGPNQTFILEDGNLKELARHKTQNGDWITNLPRGLYSVVNESGTQAKPFRLNGREENFHVTV